MVIFLDLGNSKMAMDWIVISSHLFEVPQNMDKYQGKMLMEFTFSHKTIILTLTTILTLNQGNCFNSKKNKTQPPGIKGVLSEREKQ